MSDKEHCRACGSALVECDGCHGSGMMHFDGPMDTETGYIGYDEPCSECSGRGSYAAPSPSLGDLTPETDGPKTVSPDVSILNGLLHLIKVGNASGWSRSWNAATVIKAKECEGALSRLLAFSTSTQGHKVVAELEVRNGIVSLKHTLAPLEQFYDGMKLYASPTAAPNLAQEQKPVISKVGCAEGLPYAIASPVAPVNSDRVTKALRALVIMIDTHRHIYGHEKAHYIVQENKEWEEARRALAASPASADGWVEMDNPDYAQYLRKDWVMVPREPTEEMEHRFNNPQLGSRAHTFTARYKAMLAAAPKVTK